MSKTFNQSCVSDDSVSKYLIRSVYKNNATEIAQFAALFDVSESGESWTSEGMYKFMTQYDNYYFLAAFDDNQPIAGLVVYQALSTHWKIYILSVHKNYRRLGIATELLKTFEQLAVQQNITILKISTVPVNYVGIACYKKFGFIEENVVFKMEKNLS